MGLYGVSWGLVIKIQGGFNGECWYWYLPFFSCPRFLSQAEQMMRRIGVEGVSLNEYEMNIAAHLVDPHSMKVKSR